MAHYAELDENNIVIRVLVVSNDDITIDGVEDEQSGIDFLLNQMPDSGPWVQTSYNTRGGVHYAGGSNKTIPDGGTALRGNYAGIGWTYDESNDVFISPQPYPSWILDEGFIWRPPTPYPVIPLTAILDGELVEMESPHRWDEATTSWVSPLLIPGAYVFDTEGIPVFVEDGTTPYPGDGNNPPFYRWNRDTGEWDEVPE